MPTTYAHWRFGNECYKAFPDNLKKIIEKYRNCFDYGVHGPDIFFYFNVFKSNEVNDYGTGLHTIPYSETLQMFKKNYQASDNKDAAKAYLLGFLTHFMYDSYAHSYIEAKKVKSNVAHLKIEAKYDRYLLIKDGYNPVKKSVTFSLIPTRLVAHTLAQLYDQFDNHKMLKVVRNQRIYLDILKDNSDAKRKILLKSFKKFNAQKYNDLLIGKDEDLRLKDSNLRLDKYAETAQEHLLMLLDNYLDFLDGDASLDSYFNHHFEQRDDYLDIPVLSYEDELNYSVPFNK